MSIHPNSNKVVGGIEGPRFLIVGPELSPNISFEDGLTGVGGSSGSASQLFDPTTPFLDYVLRIEDDSSVASEHAEFAVSAGEDIAMKRFIAFAHMRSDSEDPQPMWSDFDQLTGDHTYQITVDRIWRRNLVHEVIVPDDASGQTLYFRIYPAANAGGVSNQGAIRVDDFHLRKVIADYTFPIAPRGNTKETWRKIFQAQHELADGSLKTYKKGFRYTYEAFYEHLDPSYEMIRSLLMMTEYEIMFFPHRDHHQCYLVKWADELERSWAYGTAAHGHEGDIALVSQEIIHVIPTEVIDALNQYNYPEDQIYVEGGQDTIVIAY